jgi:hypothetical protein
MSRALGRALQLLQHAAQQEQPREPAAAQMVDDAQHTTHYMQSSLGVFVAAWLRSGGPGSRTANSVQVGLQVAESGVLNGRYPKIRYYCSNLVILKFATGMCYLCIEAQDFKESVV